MINLLPPDYVKRYRFDRIQILIGIIIISLVITLIIGGSYYLKLVGETKILNHKINLVEKKLLKVNKEASGLNNLEDKVARLKESIKKQDDIVGEKIEWSTILIELQKVITEKSWIKDFQVSQEQLFSLTGYTLEQQDLNIIVNRLQFSPYFDKVFVNLTQREELDRGAYGKKPVLMYQISGELIGSSGDQHGLVE